MFLIGTDDPRCLGPSIKTSHTRAPSTIIVFEYILDTKHIHQSNSCRFQLSLPNLLPTKTERAIPEYRARVPEIKGTRVAMFGTWKYDPETDEVQNLRRAYDPITARSSQHQACNRCHEKKVVS
jgi:hypothetical protein